MNSLGGIRRANAAAMRDVGPIIVPNERSRLVIAAVAIACVERCEALGSDAYGRSAQDFMTGAFTALRFADDEATADFARKVLERVNANGYDAVLAIVREVTGPTRNVVMTDANEGPTSAHRATIAA